MSHGATFYELQRSFAVSGIQASFDEERKRNKEILAAKNTTELVVENRTLDLNL